MNVNGNDVNKLAAKTHSRFKVFKSFEWDDYLKNCDGDLAPKECFNHPFDPPVNEFEINQKLEVNSPHNFDFVHLATVVNFIGPRLQLRLDGCDNSNDIFELVDSQAINPIGTRQQRNKYFAAPLRFRKDAASYASFCQSALKTAVPAPKSAFKPPPKEPPRNMFKPGMKLEAVDLKHPSSICPATVSDIDKDSVMIHLDGWDESNDYKCTFKARTLFPVGWCKKTGYPLQYPGPKVDMNKYNNLKSDEKDASITSTTTNATNTINNQQSTTDIMKESISPSTTEKIVPKASDVPDDSKSIHINIIANNNIQKKAEIKSPFPKSSLAKAEIKPSTSPVKPNVGLPQMLTPVVSNNKIHAVSQSTTATNHHMFTTISPVSVSKPSFVPVVSTKSASVATATIIPKATVTNNNLISSKSTNHNIHLTPKSNNIGDQIKQQQQQLMQNHKVNIKSHMSSLHLNNIDRGIKRPSQPTEAEKKKSVMVQANYKPVMKINSAHLNPGKPNPNPPFGKPIVTLQPKPAAVTVVTTPAATTVISNTTFTVCAPVVNGNKKQSAISKYITIFPDSNVVKGWSVEDVIEFLNLRLPEFNKYESQFRSHEIDGNAFLLLTNESIIKFMNIKLGYSLKICNIVDRINESDS